MLTLKTPGNGLWDHLGFDTETFIHSTFAHCHRTTPQTGYKVENDNLGPSSQQVARTNGREM